MNKVINLILLFIIVFMLSGCDSLKMKDPVVSFCTDHPEDIMCSEEKISREQMIKNLVKGYLNSTNLEEKETFCNTYFDSINTELIDSCILGDPGFIPIDVKDLDNVFELLVDNYNETLSIQVDYKDGETGYIFDLEISESKNIIIIDSLTYRPIIGYNPFTAADFTDVINEYFLDIYDYSFSIDALIDEYFEYGYLESVVAEDILYLRNWRGNYVLDEIIYIEYFDGVHVIKVNYTELPRSSLDVSIVFSVIIPVRIVDGYMKIQPFIGDYTSETFTPSNTDGLELIYDVLEEYYDGTLNCFKRFQALNIWFLFDDFPEDQCLPYLDEFIPNGEIISLDIELVTDSGFLLTTVYTDVDTDLVITRVNYIEFQMGMYGLSIGTFETYEWYQQFKQN